MLKIRLEPRPSPSKRMVYLSPLLAILLMLLFGLAVFSGLGQNPATAFHAFFVEPINDLYGFGELLIKASPLALIALGLSVGFCANIWNIGAEGQLTMGAIAAGGPYDMYDAIHNPLPPSLRLLTFCVLVLRNGFTVTGESACVSPESFDAEIGQNIARQNAVEKIWPLMGYALKNKLAFEPEVSA